MGRLPRRRDGSAGSTPRIVELLTETCRGQPGANASWPRGPYQQILLYAAIRLRTHVPVETLRALADSRWETPVLILLQFSPDERGKEDLLLAMLDRRPKGSEGAIPSWTAINNNLLQLRSSPWGVRLLKEVEIRHRFQVVDGPFGLGGSAGGPAWGSGGWGAWPNDFPPRIFYYLTLDREAGGALAAAGPRNVYSVREEIKLGERPTGSSAVSSQFGVGQRSRFEYLAALGAIDFKEVQALFERTGRVEWQGAAPLIERIDHDVERQIAGIRQFADRLTASGISGLPGLNLKVTIQLEDLRRLQQEELPAVEPREFVLP